MARSVFLITGDEARLNLLAEGLRGPQVALSAGAGFVRGDATPEQWRTMVLTNIFGVGRNGASDASRADVEAAQTAMCQARTSRPATNLPRVSAGASVSGLQPQGAACGLPHNQRVVLWRELHAF